MVTAAAVASAVAALAGCGGDRAASDPAPETAAADVVSTETEAGEPQATEPQTTPEPEPKATAKPKPTPKPRPTPAATTVTIVVRDGRVTGGIARPKVKRGERVVLVVRSDVADHVHLHGYDVMVDVPAGKSVRLPFEATIPGRFEVELEDRGLQIADVEVRP